jgi:hypothetical protein
MTGKQGRGAPGRIVLTSLLRLGAFGAPARAPLRTRQGTSAGPILNLAEQGAARPAGLSSLRSVVSALSAPTRAPAAGQSKSRVRAEIESNRETAGITTNGGKHVTCARYALFNDDLTSENPSSLNSLITALLADLAAVGT